MLSFSKKLYLGFSTTLLLLIIVGVTAFFALMHSSEGFGEYRTLARSTNTVGRIQANMLMIRLTVKDFIISSSKKSEEDYKLYWNKTQTYINEATDVIKNAEQIQIINKIKAELTAYNLSFNDVVKLNKERNKLVDNVLNIEGPFIEKNLTSILTSAKNDDDVVAAYNASLATRNLLLGRLYVLKFLNENEQSTVVRANKEFSEMKKMLVILDTDLQNPQRRALLKEVIKKQDAYLKAFAKVSETIFSRNKIINNKLNKIGPVIAKVTEDLKLSIKKTQDTLGPELQQSNATAILFIGVIVLIALISGALISLFITKSTIKNLGGDPADVTNIVKKVAEGDLTVHMPDNNEINTSLYAAVRVMVKSLEEKAKLARKIADGDLSVSVILTSDRDVLGEALKDMVSNLNRILNDIQNAGEQIAAGSSQVSDFSHSLAEGANQQKDNLQTISAALEQLSVQTTQNARDAKEANQFANVAKNAVTEGKSHMQEMVTAMSEIKDAGDNISGFINTIDEIAEQTNLLALNAAIEAARAGEQGRGFAVVADEVRNLASRSTQAAAETAKLIQLSASKTENGATIASNTESALENIFNGINDTAELVTKITSASNEQALAVNEVTQSIASIGEVVDLNASGSTQGAAAAEELSNEATSMKDTMSYFKVQKSE